MNKDDLICPITNEIFYDPVLALDGITYEREAIETWFIENETSPVTREKIGKLVIPSKLIKNLVDNMIAINSNLKMEQYTKVVKCDITIIIKHILSGQYGKLKNYANFDLRQLLDEKYFLHLKKCDNDTLKYIIDNAITLECHNDLNGRPIHFICRYLTPEMIKYILDKDVDLECQTNLNWRPIHFICRYSTPEMIKYIIDKGVDLECQNKYGLRPIHLVCAYSTSEIIKYVIDKNVDIECQDNRGRRPIHILCQYSTSGMIKYILEKGVDTTCKTKEDIDCIQLLNENNNIDDEERLELIQLISKS